MPDLREVLPTSNFNISRQCVCLFYAGSSRTPLASVVTSHSLPPARALAWRRSRSRSCGGCSRPSRAVRVRRLLCAAGAAAAAVQWLSPLLLAACARCCYSRRAAAPRGALLLRAGCLRRYLPARTVAARGSRCCVVVAAVRRLSPSLPAHALCALACCFARLAPSLLCRLSPSRRRLSAARSRWRRCCCARPDHRRPRASTVQGVLLCAAVTAAAVRWPSPSLPPPSTRCTRAGCCCARLAAVCRLSPSLPSPSTRYAREACCCARSGAVGRHPLAVCVRRLPRPAIVAGCL